MKHEIDIDKENRITSNKNKLEMDTLIDVLTKIRWKPKRERKHRQTFRKLL